MKPLRHRSSFLGSAALAAFLVACAPQALPQGPTAQGEAPSLAAPAEVTRSLGAPTENRATLRFERPVSPYRLALNAVPTVHRWVPNDVVQYVVAFKKQVGDNQYEETGYAEVTVPLKGDAPKSTAVFSKVPWGSVYRAFVTAKGNIGGDVNGTLVVLNDVAATADFDFTQTQDTPSQVSKSVRVVFNQVLFSGVGSVGIQTPAEGTYANPQGEIQATATTAPI